MSDEFEYEVQGNYGQHGWEVLTTESSQNDAREQLATYEREEPGVPHRIHRVRVEGVDR